MRETQPRACRTCASETRNKNPAGCPGPLHTFEVQQVARPARRAHPARATLGGDWRGHVFEHVGACRIASLVASAMHALVLQTVEKAFARRVPAITLAPHRRQHSMSNEFLLKDVGSRLRYPISDPPAPTLGPRLPAELLYSSRPILYSIRLTRNPSIRPMTPFRRASRARTVSWVPIMR
jgi:hypothetical protein